MYEESIGKAVAAVRNAKKLTQKQVAGILGLHFSWLSAVENGRRNLDLETLRKLCDALEVSVLDITDMAYANSRAETLQYLRDTGGRLPDERAVSLSDLQERVRWLMRGFESLVEESFRFVQQPSQLDILRNRLSPFSPSEDPPIPPKRRGRPPAPASSTPKRGKKTPVDKKG
jgi:transcriptional regulator with XRE-family HTH domain